MQRMSEDPCSRVSLSSNDHEQMYREDQDRTIICDIRLFDI